MWVQLLSNSPNLEVPRIDRGTEKCLNLTRNVEELKNCLNGEDFLNNVHSFDLVSVVRRGSERMSTLI